MASELFSEANVENVTQAAASTSAVVFCHRKDHGYEGDDINQNAKVCNDFFHMPSDIGIILTKNMDIKDVTKEAKDYESLFQGADQKASEFIVGGTMWSETTLVIDTEHHNEMSQLYLRKTKSDKNKGEDASTLIQLQIHQSKEFANMIQEIHHDDQTKPLSLESGKEYFIDILPKGQISTEEFKALSYKQRNCKLEQEFDNSGIFKIYTQMNCKYQCRVEMAADHCGCLPWDFVHNVQYEECDPFGRTCFYNKMKQITQSAVEACKHCTKECDYIKFLKHVTDVKDLASGPSGGEYFKRIPDPDKWRINVGNEAFLDLLGDVNGTIIDKGLQNAYSALIASFDDNYPLNKFESLIVVHLKFKAPEITVISPKYSVFDMIGNFGGQFGLFEQITGASFLGILNLIILLIKLACPAGRNA